jgi:hypothetical protein
MCRISRNKTSLQHISYDISGVLLMLSCIWIENDHILKWSQNILMGLTLSGGEGPSLTRGKYEP